MVSSKQMQVQGALLNKFSLSRWSSQHSKVNASFVETVKPPSFWSSCCGLGVMNLTRIHEDAGSIPGLSQWDLALLGAVVQVADVAHIWHCWGCGVGWL